MALIEPKQLLGKIDFSSVRRMPLERPERRRICVGGHVLDCADGRARLHSDRRRMARGRKSAGIVFQHFNLSPHIRGGRRRERDGRSGNRSKEMSRPEAEKIARGFLCRVRLADGRRDTLPDSPGGQRRRVAIARALSRSTPPGKSDAVG